MEGITAAYGRREVLRDLDFELAPGAFAGLIGPNAAGKSTLLKVMTRVLPPARGRVILEGRDLGELSPLAVARRVAAVGQETPPLFPLAVQDLVLMGRFPHLGRFRSEGPRDLAAVRRALALTGTLPLAGRNFADLSAGERQRVLIARALAQQPAYLLLDEPTAHLDINFQVEIMDLLRRLNRREGLAVLVVLHDLNLAALYCDELALIHRGRLHSRGTPEQVLLSSHLEEVYGSRTVISRHPLQGVPQVTLVSGREAPPEERADRLSHLVHVVGGGGSATWLLEALAAAGFRLTAGVLNRGDSDWVVARSLGIEVVEAPPFSAVDAAARRRNAHLMREADWIVLADIPFGRGNLANLEDVRDALVAGGRGVVIEATPPAERDFTGGAATAVYAEVINRAAEVAQSDLDALRWLVERGALGPGRMVP